MVLVISISRPGLQMVTSACHIVKVNILLILAVVPSGCFSQRRPVRMNYHMLPQKVCFPLTYVLSHAMYAGLWVIHMMPNRFSPLSPVFLLSHYMLFLVYIERLLFGHLFSMSCIPIFLNLVILPLSTHCSWP
jgi:hypothetical protein